MNAQFLESRSVWLEHSRPRFGKLDVDAEFDAVIIGGGITGLTAAYLLNQAGKHVAVFEKGRIGDAETGHTTAHLTYVTDTRLKTLVDTFGEQAARLAWRGGAAAIDTIEAIAREERLSCGFRRVPGFLHAALNRQSDQIDDLCKDVDLAVRLGFDAAFLMSVPLVQLPGIRFANQAYFHPIEYLAGLSMAFKDRGGEIFEESEVGEVESDPLLIRVNERTVRCGKLIIATHVPLMGLTNLVSATLFQSKLAGYSTYAIGAKAPEGQMPHASFWDTSDPYYYLRIDAIDDGNYLIFGGEDHKTGQHDDPDKRYDRLERVLQTFVPGAIVDHRWSGQVIETNDGLPYIGPMTDQQFVATGFAGNGMTFGTLAGMMACDWVLGRENPWQDLFHVDRRKLRGGTWDYLKENVDYPYHLVKGFLRSPEVKSPEAVGRGEGGIVMVDGHRCAVSRSAEGKLNVVSAICTHMGCVVRWNGAEQTWDCPCHGSRFGTDGHVIAGPAETPLEKYVSKGIPE